jgi:hypothetical protein
MFLFIISESDDDNDDSRETAAAAAASVQSWPRKRRDRDQIDGRDRNAAGNDVEIIQQVGGGGGKGNDKIQQQQQHQGEVAAAPMSAPPNESFHSQLKRARMVAAAGTESVVNGQVRAAVGTAIASQCSSPAVTPSPLLEQIPPYVQILEQPASHQMRFRYECEAQVWIPLIWICTRKRYLWFL